MNTELPFSHLTALLYPQLHFFEYGGKYRIPSVPDGPGKYAPFDDREEFLLQWLHLAIQHRQPNSVHSLVPEVLNFYNYHLQKFFADIQCELEAFCKASNRTSLYEQLFLLIDHAFVNLHNTFETDLSLIANNMEPLSTIDFHYTSYEEGRTYIEEELNNFASAFFKKSKGSYTDYANQLCNLINAIGKNVSIAYPGETACDYLRRQTGLRTQYKFDD